jgi:F420-dependent oxidoreductase-like protein
MRIGLQVPNFTWEGGPAKLGSTLAQIARTADEAGFASLWVMDHFFQISQVGPPESEMLDSWTTLGFLAGVTRRVRLGTMVTGVTYRHPGLLAKIATTVDVLSGGRVYLGIGAGWYEREHRGLGVPFPPLGERFERLDEALQIVRRMWSEQGGSFEGRHYQLAEMLNVPAPLSRPHPPILVGGSGERKTLRLAARYADAVNVIYRSLETLQHKYEVLRQWCEVEGTSYEAIERTTMMPVPRRESEILASPGEIIEQCHALADIGVQHVIFNRVPDLDRRTSLEILGREVIPAVAAF